MSAPVGFEGSNFTYGGPPGTDVADLHVFKHPQGVSFVFRFTPEEIQQIVESGCVWVDLMTHNVPPILLSAEPLVQLPDQATGVMRPSKPEPFLPRARIGGRIPEEKA